MVSSSKLEQSVLFSSLRSILNNLYQQVTQQLPLFSKSEQPFENFSDPEQSMTGSLLTFSGQQIDKLVFSHLQAKKLGFSTMRLTVWLNSYSQVPHLAFEFGTIPQPFFYIDYIPRIDLWMDLSYVERYYEILNSLYLDLRKRSDFSVFISKSLYVRQIQSPAHLCFTCPPTPESLDLINNISESICSQWLTWVKEASSLSANQQAFIAERDLQMRKISAERDPGNLQVSQVFGTELTKQLVEALWTPELPQ